MIEDLHQGKNPEAHLPKEGAEDQELNLGKGSEDQEPNLGKGSEDQEADQLIGIEGLEGMNQEKEDCHTEDIQEVLQEEEAKVPPEDHQDFLQGDVKVPLGDPEVQLDLELHHHVDPEPHH